MATETYVGGQVLQTEIQKATVTAVAAAGTLKVTINGKVITYVCTAADTVATAAANLVSLLRAAQDQEFQQFSAATDSTTPAQINFTENTPGVFLSVDGNTAITVAGAGGSTITSAVVQRGLSPADAGDVLNWSLGALPSNGNDWVFEDAHSPALYRLSALSAKTPASLTVRNTYAGAGVGLPKFNAAGNYLEYRGGRLALSSCAIMTIGQPSGSTPEAFRFDVGSSTACALVVTGDGTGQVGQEVVDWIGTNAGNTAEVDGGSLKIASYVGEVATVATLKLNNAACRVGSGTTLTTVKSSSSILDLSAGCTTLTQDGDSSQSAIRLAAAITTLEVQAGSCFHNGTGTIGTLTVGPGATIDFSGSKAPITITNKVNLHKGSTFWDPNGRVTLTAGWTTVECSASDVVTNFGPGRSYTVT